ncbi:MAG: hydantoinase B/oxoprolinase family protein [Acidobacteriota bacterium]
MSSAVTLAIVRDLLVSVCEEMGVALERAATSINVRERRDYSIAIFDARGRALVSGDHMPVHLGSMPLSMEAILAKLRPGPGDVAILNDPFDGGTHLPDITMAAPVFAGRRLLFFVACRAHHSDVGGMTPGSMPLATEIFQEGFRIPPMLYVRRGRVDGAFLTLLLQNVRTPGERVADLAAQRACLDLGARRLAGLCARDRSLPRTAARLFDYAARATSAVIRQIPRGRFAFEDALDDDGIDGNAIPIAVAISRRGGTLEIDFRRSGAQVRGSVNAGRAVTVSAVAYVLRCLSGAEVPMGSGCLRDVRILTRPGSVVDALAPAAVCGGNVETSQRIVDVLLGALAKAIPGIPAASQGTMNNVALGGTRPDGSAFAYYETVGGGTGASTRRDGLSAVHSHMTNSRNSPVEILESLYPVRVRRYAVRRGSGGAGRRRGGDGIVREIEALVPATLTLLTERRRIRPWAIAGGRPGKPGRNTLVGTTGDRVLPSKATLALREGDVIRVETPGGGGHGAPVKARAQHL